MERALLACCLVDPNAIAKVYTIINGKMFYEPKYRIIWDTMVEIFNAGNEIDFLVVSDELRAKNQISKFQGEEAYFMDLSKEEVTSTHITQYAETVREAYACRSMQIITEKYSKLITESDQNSQELSSSIISKLSNIHSAMIGTKIVCVDEVAKAIVEEAQRLKDEGDTHESWLLTGVTTLDNWFGGLRPGRLYMVAGAPGGGKTDLLINWAINLSKNAPVGIISAEMTKDDLVVRMIANYCDIDSKKIENGVLSDRELGKLWANISLDDKRIYIDDSSQPTAIQIKARAITMQAQLGIKVLLIDHLQELKHHTSSGNENADWRHTVKAIRDMSKDLPIPVVLLNQLTKEALTEGKRPYLKDLRQTGAEESDVVMMLHYTKTPELGEHLEYIVRKNRRGQLGIIRCYYDKTTGKQGELNRDNEPTSSQPKQPEEPAQDDEAPF